jgi:phosphoribosylaminoimidazole carboxylase PurE protein
LAQKVLIVMGSNSDLAFAQKIADGLSQYSIPCEMRIASAHRNPEYLLKILREYSSSGDEVVAITVAGLSDALSGVVAAQRLFPVIACPPDTEKYDYPKVFSSAFTPSDVPVAFINDPAKAANFVAQVFALTNAKLRSQISLKLEEKKKQIEKLDKDLFTSPSVRQA